MNLVSCKKYPTSEENAESTIRKLRTVASIPTLQFIDHMFWIEHVSHFHHFHLDLGRPCGLWPLLVRAKLHVPQLALRTMPRVPGDMISPVRIWSSGNPGYRSTVGSQPQWKFVVPLKRQRNLMVLPNQTCSFLSLYGCLGKANFDERVACIPPVSRCQWFP